MPAERPFRFDIPKYDTFEVCVFLCKISNSDETYNDTRRQDASENVNMERKWMPDRKDDFPRRVKTCRDVKRRQDKAKDETKDGTRRDDWS